MLERNLVMEDKKGIKSVTDRICKYEQVKLITALKNYAEKRAEETSEAILFHLLHPRIKHDFIYR